MHRSRRVGFRFKGVGFRLYIVSWPLNRVHILGEFLFNHLSALAREGSGRGLDRQLGAFGPLYNFLGERTRLLEGSIIFITRVTRA